MNIIKYYFYTISIFRNFVCILIFIKFSFMKPLFAYICAMISFALFIPQYSYSQVCTAVGPSSTFDSNVQSVNLLGDAGTSINYTGCPGVTGLQDLTASQSVSLTTGTPYTANVQFGTCGGNYNSAGEAWIDWNQSTWAPH